MQRELNYGNMIQNLSEGMHDLEHLRDRIHYLRTGNVVGSADRKRLMFEERHHPVDEISVQLTLEHACQHLGWAWNERHCTNDEIRSGISNAEKSLSGTNLRLVYNGKPLIPKLYGKYRKWKNAQRHKCPPKSPAEFIARAIMMHPAFELSNIAMFGGVETFYPHYSTRLEYCRAKREGWQDLVWSIGDKIREKAYWRQCNLQDGYDDALMPSVKAADAMAFMMQLSILGLRLTMQTIRMVVEMEGFELIVSLMKFVPEFWKLITPRQLLFWVCADGRFHGDGAVLIIREIERRHPGIVRGTVDLFGDTPLWYTLYRYQYGGYVHVAIWRENAPKLIRLLKRLGCDPNRKNALGVSWREIKKEIGRMR